jgi:uncharacterized protein YdhG (YjbR/CyaY superfamily)
MKPLPEQTNTVDGYIAQYPDEMQKRLNTLRDLIKTTIPKAIEDISYGMPAYRAQPKKRPFVFFGVAKEHIGLYALGEKLSPELQKEVAPHVTGRGTLQFTHSEPLPLELIKRILTETKDAYGL